MAVSWLLSCVAFFDQLERASLPRDLEFSLVRSRRTPRVPLGWVLDPLTAIMLMMVTLLSLLIFIYSLGYMAHDENFTRFFCFMSLFAAAMLGIVIANSLLLLFICWELVGLSSYLLIGFWFEKPAAAAAAKKAFITTRIGDIGLLLGMLWLYSQSGTLLFYDHGHGCLEQSSLARLVAGHDRRRHGCLHRDLAADFCRRGRANPARCPCTSGCRTRWKARRRSAR